MKFNVKGLAFVGFAAAILSANAMAAAGDEKIVTSKKYVDDTFQVKGSYEVTTNKELSKETLTTNRASTDRYPSNKAITDYIDAVVEGDISTNAQSKSSADYQMGGANGTWKTVETDSYVNVAQGTTVGDVKISIDGKVTNSGAALTATGATASNLTTEKAVVEYVDAQNYVTAADQVQANWNETDSSSKAYIQNKPTQVSTFTNDAGYITSADVPAQVQADWSQATTTATDYIKNKPTKLSDFTNDVVNNETLTITVDGTATTFTANSATPASVTVNVPVKAVSLNGANVAPDASGNVALTNVESTTNKATAITTGVGGNFDSTTAYATTKAVYDYVSALPGSTAIPATCTDATPCAFVATSSGAAWIQMAQN